MLQIDNPSNLDSLQWRSNKRSQPQAHEIEVKATGVNFRDVMVALDLYPDATKFLGLECAGIVTKVGNQVSNFKVGDQFMAIADQSFSQYLNLNSLLAIHIPKSSNLLEAAASLPLVLLTIADFEYWISKQCFLPPTIAASACIYETEQGELRPYQMPLSILFPLPQSSATILFPLFSLFGLPSSKLFSQR